MDSKNTQAQNYGIPKNQNNQNNQQINANNIDKIIDYVSSTIIKISVETTEEMLKNGIDDLRKISATELKKYPKLVQLLEQRRILMDNERKLKLLKQKFEKEKNKETEKESDTSEGQDKKDENKELRERLAQEIAEKEKMKARAKELSEALKEEKANTDRKVAEAVVNTRNDILYEGMQAEWQRRDEEKARMEKEKEEKRKKEEEEAKKELVEEFLKNGNNSEVEEKADKIRREILESFAEAQKEMDDSLEKILEDDTEYDDGRDEIEEVFEQLKTKKSEIGTNPDLQINYNLWDEKYNILSTDESGNSLESAIGMITLKRDKDNIPMDGKLIEVLGKFDEANGTNKVQAYLNAIQQYKTTGRHITERYMRREFKTKIKYDIKKLYYKTAGDAEGEKKEYILTYQQRKDILEVVNFAQQIGIATVVKGPIVWINEKIEKFFGNRQKNRMLPAGNIKLFYRMKKTGMEEMDEMEGAANLENAFDYLERREAYNQSMEMQNEKALRENSNKTKDLKTEIHYDVGRIDRNINSNTENQIPIEPGSHDEHD